MQSTLNIERPLGGRGSTPDLARELTELHQTYCWWRRISLPSVSANLNLSIYTDKTTIEQIWPSHEKNIGPYVFHFLFATLYIVLTMPSAH